MQKNYFYKYSEIGFFIILLSLAALMPPDDAGISFCSLKFIGFDFCPGCGLAHSISHFFHGNIKESLREHPLGICAVIIICCRILHLFRLHIFSKGVLRTKKLYKNYGVHKQQRY